MLNGLSFGEILSLGGLTTLVGIGVVFLVLILLVVIVKALPKLNGLDFKRPKANMVESALSANEISEAETNLNASKNEEIIAAITAAISMILESENKTNVSRAKFVVKSINRI